MEITISELVESTHISDEMFELVDITKDIVIENKSICVFDEISEAMSGANTRFDSIKEFRNMTHVNEEMFELVEVIKGLFVNVEMNKTNINKIFRKVIIELSK